MALEKRPSSQGRFFGGVASSRVFSRWRYRAILPSRSVAQRPCRSTAVNNQKPNPAIGMLALNNPVERLPINEFEDLGEYVVARVHCRASSKTADQSSNE